MQICRRYRIIPGCLPGAYPHVGDAHALTDDHTAGNHLPRRYWAQVVGGDVNHLGQLVAFDVVQQEDEGRLFH